MGQITNPIVLGITVNPIDRETGPGAGAGSTSNNALMLGLNAGQNSSANDLVILGSQSGKAGIAGGVSLLDGTIIVGAFSGQALQTHNAATVNTPSAVIILGDKTLQSTVQMDSTIAIGQQIFPSTTGVGFSGNVLIGNGIGQLTTGASFVQQSVIIGHGAFGPPTASAPGNSAQNVIIGYQALLNNASACAQNVFIGSGVGPTAGNPLSGGSLQQNVVIGALADTQDNATGNVTIGYLAKSLQSTGGSGGNNVNVGFSSIGAALTDTIGGNVVIGARASIPQSTTAGQNVIIGNNAGQALIGTTPSLNNTLIIETNNATATAQKCLIFGNFVSGNLILGNSISGTTQDTGGAGATNIVKIINGTIGAANPVGGGYFYVTGGVLHWVDSAGNDSQLSEGAGQLAANALHAFTNNAGAAVGTLNNAPAAGNPTKWIPINDNGTIRNVPSW